MKQPKIIKFAIVGSGNIGEAVLDTYKEDLEFCRKNNEPIDMELVGIVSQHMAGKKCDLGSNSVNYVENVNQLEKRPDVLILCGRSDDTLLDNVAKYLEQKFYTVDPYDTHEKIFANRKRFNTTARKSGVAALHATGWDPGLYSTERAISYRINPFVPTFVNYGPGRSMGHTGQVKTIMEKKFGIKDPIAISITSHFKTGDGILVPGKHQRDVFLVVPNETIRPAVEEAIQSDGYFAKNSSQETIVHFVDQIIFKSDLKVAYEFDKSNKKIVYANDRMHSGYLISQDKNAKFEVMLGGAESGQGGDNPIMTARMLYSGARGVVRQKPGAYLDSMIAQLDFVKGSNLNDRMKRSKV